MAMDENTLHANSVNHVAFGRADSLNMEIKDSIFHVHSSWVATFLYFIKDNEP